MIGKKFRVNFLSCHAPSSSGVYKVVTRCYLTDAAGQRILPSGTVFGGSTNIYTGGISTFEQAYRGTNVWHSIGLAALDTPFWGTVEFQEPREISGIYWQATGYAAANRSPKNWSLERWDDTAGQWVQAWTELDQPPWVDSEERQFYFSWVTGHTVSLQGAAEPKAVVFDWSDPDKFGAAVFESNGDWSAPRPVSPGGQYGIYYQSADGRCPPISHGPYTAE